MTIEIERKFVLTDTPSAAVLGPGVRLRQGYLAEDGDVQVRCRLRRPSGWAERSPGWDNASLSRLGRPG